MHIVKADPDNNTKLEMVTKFTHYYPASKIRWHRTQSGENIITAGKNISIWSYNDLDDKVVHLIDLINRHENASSGP